MIPRAGAAAVLALAGAVLSASAQTIPPPAPAADSRVILQTSTTPGLAANKIPVGACMQPVYPREALRYELEGVATAKFRLQPDGQVAEPTIVKSSGWALLDEATIRFMKACNYSAEQAAGAKGAWLPIQLAWKLNAEQPSTYPGIVPGSCAPSGRFDGFQPLDGQATDDKGVKVRFLIDKGGAPQAIKLEARDLPAKAAAEVAGFLAGCRFAFDPQVTGIRSDTMYGRVLLR